MAEEKLNFLQFAASMVAQVRGGKCEVIVHHYRQSTAYSRTYASQNCRRNHSAFCRIENIKLLVHREQGSGPCARYRVTVSLTGKYQ